MFTSGRAFIDGGFRPVIIKQGHKWSQVLYMDGQRIRVRRVRGEVKVTPAYGDIKTLAKAFSKKYNVLGFKLSRSKTATSILREITHG